jgi:hypothetical protein
MQVEFDNQDEFLDICLKIDTAQTGKIMFDSLYSYWKEAVKGR